MSKPRMSIHSLDSFNETKAINLLSSVLESHHSIKTFFSANDRTPNHDGFFELVSSDSSPKKQFIVQIKKVENLKPNIIGPNKGKYSYELKTNFLNYVKDKVTENPAIYFVIDTITSRIFWLFLSDTVLMSLNFEGHEKITYAFGEDDILADIDVFTAKLNAIADARNRIFLKKTPEEIGEIQEAVEYINSLLNHDFSLIKSTMFPTLWRFGIKTSNTSDLSIEVHGNRVKPELSSIIALYPQIKGVPDTGIREYSHEDSDLFNHIHLGGSCKPIEYCKEALHKIIKSFFEGYITLSCLPNIALEELVGNFFEESDRLFGVEHPTKLIQVSEAECRFCYLANYINQLLTNDSVLSNSEKQIKESILRRYFRGERNFCRFSSYISSLGGKEAFQIFCDNNPALPSVFNSKMFEIMDHDYIQLYCIFHELRERSINEFPPVWTYSNYLLRSLPEKEFDKESNAIIDHWFEDLPELYNNTYAKLFETDKYRFNGKYVYSCKGTARRSEELACVSSIIHVYPSSSFQIFRDDSIETNFNETTKNKGVEKIINGLLLDEFLTGKALYYESICCLLYEGVCRELGYKPKRLRIQKKSSVRGLLLFD